MTAEVLSVKARVQYVFDVRDNDLQVDENMATTDTMFFRDWAVGSGEQIVRAWEQLCKLADSEDRIFIGIVPKSKWWDEPKDAPENAQEPAEDVLSVPEGEDAKEEPQELTEDPGISRADAIRYVKRVLAELEAKDTTNGNS